MFKRFARALVVAPHADDETLGVGATMARLVDEGLEVTVALMTGKGEEPHPWATTELIEDVRREFSAAMKILGVQKTLYRDLPTTLLDMMPQHEVNRVASQILEEAQPDVVFLPFEHDLHRDHEILNYAFRVGLRQHLPSNRRPMMVLAYETPSETHLQFPQHSPSFEPNLWVDVSGHISSKLQALKIFQSQMVPAPGLRSLRGVEALATWRGAQIGVEAAEAFVVLRMIA